MEHPIRLAHCDLLQAEDAGRRWSRSLCNKPWDCSKCPIMVRSLERVSPEVSVGWECYSCLEETKNVPRKIPGYYTGSSSPGLPDGCSRCGFPSQLLQLVLRSPP